MNDRHRTRPRYGTWIRTNRFAVFAALTGGGLVVCGLAFVSPWFLMAVVPTLVGGYITTILALTRYRLGPRGGDGQRRIHDLVVARAEPVAHHAALDVGCGSGSLTIALARASAHGLVTGVDPWGPSWPYSQQQCEANARIEGVDQRTTFLRGSGAHLDVPDESFDVVVSCMTFHEMRDVPHPLVGVAEAIRVLRPGGRFVFVDPFADPAFYPSIGEVRATIERAGASVAELEELAAVLPLPFPLRHPKVLGRAMLVVGAKAPVTRP